MTWGHRIRALVDQYPGADPLELARKLLVELDEAELVALIAEEVEHAQRATARTVERATFLPSSDVSARGLIESRDRGNWRTLMTTPFDLGGGQERVAWGAATVEEHRRRIALLEKLRNGIDATIDRHHRAIALIEAAGVKCLNEIELAA